MGGGNFPDHINLTMNSSFGVQCLLHWQMLRVQQSRGEALQKLSAYVHNHDITMTYMPFPTGGAFPDISIVS